MTDERRGAKPLQFSIRLMLVATAAVAAGVGLWIAEPSWQIGLIETVMALSLPALLLAAVAAADARCRAVSLVLFVGTFLPSLAHVNQIVSNSRVEFVNASVGGMIVDSEFGANIRSGLVAGAQTLHTVLLLWTIAPFTALLWVLFHWLIGPLPPESRP